MKSKFLVGFPAYIKLFILHFYKCRGHYFLSFILVSTSFDTFSPAIYLKEFVIATILVLEWQMKNVSVGFVESMFHNFKDYTLELYFKQDFRKSWSMNRSPCMHLKEQLSTTSFDKSLWNW